MVDLGDRPAGGEGRELLSTVEALEVTPRIDARPALHHLQPGESGIDDLEAWAHEIATD
jgi:hypothetical protein